MVYIWKNFLFAGCTKGNLFIYEKVYDSDIPVFKQQMNLQEAGIYVIKKVTEINDVPYFILGQHEGIISGLCYQNKEFKIVKVTVNEP